MIVLPFNHCHESLQYSPSSSLSSSCNDSAVIFKRLSATALSFFSRFFQPHFLILNIRAFVARGKFFRPHRAKFYCTLTICLFFFDRGKQAGSLPTFFRLLYTIAPSITRELVRNRSQIKTSGPSYVAWYFRRCWQITVNTWLEKINGPNLSSSITLHRNNLSLKLFVKKRFE